MPLPEKADSIVSRSSKKRKNRKKRARQWSCYVDNLKNTIDCMYEMCRSEQSVAGCREAILYLERANNDFKSLIETINVEQEWTDQEPEKRPSVAWEVRKSMSSPNPITMCDKPLLPISSMIVEAVRNATNVSSPSMAKPICFSQEQHLAPPANGMGTLTYARITAAAAVAAVAVAAEQKQHSGGDEGWQVVGGKRRKSTSSTTVSEIDREMSVEKEQIQTPSAPLNVYERLSSSSYRRGSGYSNRPSASSSNDNNRLTCPRSAMDLPQTKASMAKMAYSRQLLWEKNQQMLVEKLRARQKRDKAQRTPSTSSTCGFTFADPLAVRQSVEAFNQQQKIRKSGNGSKNVSRANSIVSDANRSLQSINEHGEVDGNVDICQVEDMTKSTNSEDIPSDPTPSASNSSNSPSQHVQISLENQKTKEEVPAVTANAPQPSLFGYVDVDGLENDEEWRTMTEEEESLALEENSLHLEIKHAEAISIDAELERQVGVEADNLEKEHKREKKLQKRASRSAQKSEESAMEYENFYKVFQEIQSLATVAWSEIMQNTPMSSNVHEPGTPVEKHEKMSSPSRRKCLKDDDDFGKRHELKQKRADDLRQMLQEEKAAKVRELTNRVEEVRRRQADLKQKKKMLLEERMQRVAENRDKNIMEVIRKAKDDDQRVMEVKFIASLQEDNKRYDLMMKDASTEEKQKQMADERARKIEEKSAKKREQEAAAVSRRQLAAQARQTKIKQLTEKKEARTAQKTVQDEKKNTPTKVVQEEKHVVETIIPCEEPMTFMAACIEMSEENVEKHDFPWKWPNFQISSIKCCTICDVKTKSEIEEAAHVFSKQHQEKARIAVGPTASLIEELRNHLGSIFKNVEGSDDSDKVDSKNTQREGKMTESRGFLEKMQVVEPIPMPLSSPRNRTKVIRNFMMAFDKMTNCRNNIDDQTQSAVENTLSDLLKAVEEDSKNERSVNIEQFCATGMVPKMCNAILEWATKGASLRLCIRLTHAFCVFMKDPRVAYYVLFKPEFLKLMDRMMYLLQTEPTTPQLSGILDVLNSLLKCIVSRSQSLKEDSKKWKELEFFDGKVPNGIENIAKLLRSSIDENEMNNALELNRGSALTSRLVTMAEKLAGNGNKEGSSLQLEYIDMMISHGYTSRRNAEKMMDCSQNVMKTSRDVGNAVVGICQNLIKNNVIFWKKLISDPVRLLQIVTLLEDCLYRSAEISKFQNIDRDWEKLSKDEVVFLGFVNILKSIVNESDVFGKRFLMVGWSGIKNGCFEILKTLPLRYFMLEDYSNTICPVIKCLLDESLSLSEKNQLLGEFSEEFLNM